MAVGRPERKMGSETNFSESKNEDVDALVLKARMKTRCSSLKLRIRSREQAFCEKRNCNGKHEIWRSNNGIILKRQMIIIEWMITMIMK